MREICRPQKFVESTIEGYILGRRTLNKATVNILENTKLLRGWENLNKDYSLETSNSTWEMKLPIVLIIFRRQHVKNLRIQNRIDCKLSKGVEKKGGNRKKFWSIQKMLREKKKKRPG